MDIRPRSSISLKNDTTSYNIPCEVIGVLKEKGANASSFIAPFNIVFERKFLLIDYFNAWGNCSSSIKINNNAGGLVAFIIALVTTKALTRLGNFQ